MPSTSSRSAARPPVVVKADPPPPSPFAPEEKAVDRANIALKAAKAELSMARKQLEALIERRPSTTAAGKGAPPPPPKPTEAPPATTEDERKQRAEQAQVEQDRAEEQVQACKAALEKAERALRRRKVLVVAEMLEAESRRNDVAFHAEVAATAARLNELEPTRAEKLAREARREARRNRADEREEAAEMRDVCDPDFERDAERLYENFSLGDLLHPHEFRSRCTPRAYFGPAPRTAGFNYPPPPVTLPNNIKLYRLAEFKGGELALTQAPCSYGPAADRVVQVQKIEVGDPRFKPRPAHRARPPPPAEGGAAVAAPGVRDKYARARELYEAVYLVKYASTDTTWEREAPVWMTGKQLKPHPPGPNAPRDIPKWTRVWGGGHGRPFADPPPPPPRRPHPPPSPRGSVGPGAGAGAPAPAGAPAAETGAPVPAVAGAAGSGGSGRSSSRPQSARVAARPTTQSPRRPESARPHGGGARPGAGQQRPHSARARASYPAEVEPGTRLFVGDIVSAPLGEEKPADKVAAQGKGLPEWRI